VTHVFRAEMSISTSDAVFGVKEALVVDFEKRPDGRSARRRYGFRYALFEARYDFVLEQQ